MRLKRKEVEKKYFSSLIINKQMGMDTLFYFEIAKNAEVIFRSDYFFDAIVASRRASEIVILMGKCAPSGGFSYRVLSEEIVDDNVPDRYAL